MRRTCIAVWMILGINFSASAQISKLPYSALPEDFFGGAVALSGNSAIVGASGEDSCGSNAGAARIFDRDPSTGSWHTSARISCDDCMPNRFFGRNVAISGDVVVVASGFEYFATERQNVAHVFERDSDGTWHETAHLRPDDDLPGSFATAVDVDGDRILVVSSGDRLHGRYRGAAYMFERSAEGEWAQTARIEPMSGIGRQATIIGGSGAIDGSRMIVSAPGIAGTRSGSVVIFEHDEVANAWLQRAQLGGYSSANIAVDISGDLAITGDHDRGRGGSARLYGRDGTGGWALIDRLVPAVSSQSGGVGMDVAVRSGLALVVAYDDQLDQQTNIDRVVFVFESDGAGQWRQRHIIDIGETEFGASIDMDSNQVIIGSSGDFTEGSAYVVRLHGGSMLSPARNE